MKKLPAIIAMVLFFGFGVASYAADTEKPKQEASPKEFISAEMPQEVLVLVQSVTTAFPLEDKYISTKQGIDNYLLKIFITDIGEVKVLFEIESATDEKGNIKPCECNSKWAAVIFTDQKVSWFKDEATKQIYQKATS